MKACILFRENRFELHIEAVDEACGSPTINDTVMLHAGERIYYQQNSNKTVDFNCLSIFGSHFVELAEVTHNFSDRIILRPERARCQNVTKT